MDMFGDESKNPVYCRLSECGYCCCYRYQPSSALCCPQMPFLQPVAVFSPHLWFQPVHTLPQSRALHWNMVLNSVKREQHPRGQWGEQRPRGQWRGNSAPGDSWRCLETFSLSSLGDGYRHWVVTEHPAIHRARAPDRDCQEWPAQTSIVLRVGNSQKHLGSFLQMWSPKDSDTHYGKRAELSQKV